MTLAPLDVGADTKSKPEAPKPEANPAATPNFEAVKLPEPSKAAQTLGTAEGNRFTEPFRVASALVGSVFKAACALYDNARTDLRLANAAKEMAKFDPTAVNATTSAQQSLEEWSRRVGHPALERMRTLSEPMGNIIGSSIAQIDSLKEDVDSILRTQVGSKTVEQYSALGARELQSLSPSDKKAFLELYKALEGKLHTLNELKQSTDQLAVALVNSSLELGKTASDFWPKVNNTQSMEYEAYSFYVARLNTLHEQHYAALTKLVDQSPTPDQILEVGEKFTQELKALQQSTESLSSSLVAANKVESQVAQTLLYLRDGAPAVGVSDKSVVFVGADAADKIAGWVEAQTKEARDAMNSAKAAKNPGAIAEATEKLEAASDVVHKQLDNIAALMSKINGGKTADGSATESQEDRVLAKAREANVTDHDSFTAPLNEYVGLLRKEMESRIATMFTADADGKYDLTAGKKELAVIDKYDDMLERAVDKAKEGGLTAQEVKEAIDKIHAKFKDELNPSTKPVKSRIDDIVETTMATKERELAPKPAGILSRFRSWVFSNN